MASRPVVAELEAIGRAIAFAEDTGCALHIVHVSSGRGVALVAEARARGVDVTCETCPHYLLLTPAGRRGARRGGQVRAAGARDAERERLWQLVAAAPSTSSPPTTRPRRPSSRRASFGDAWGGIAGCQTTLELLLSAERPRRSSGRAADLDAAPPSASGSPRKGRIEVGADADLALVDLDAEHTLPPATCATATRSRPGSAAGCAPGSCARCCAARRPGPRRRPRRGC